MFKNYILTSLRLILRQKGYSVINILGLATGLASMLLIFLWVQDELSFDKFHKNASRLYRVEEDQHYSGSVYHVNVTPYPSGPVWKEEIPEIEDACRFQWPAQMLFRYGDKAFYEPSAVAVDPSFLTMFSFPLLKGDIHTALSEPYSAILTEETALKYFGRVDPLGKSINADNKYEFTVTGIMKDLPTNTILKFDILVPFKFLQETGQYDDQWGNNSIRTFILLRENAIIDSINSKLTSVYRQNQPGGETDFLVAPFPKIHLHAYGGYNHTPGAIIYVYIFSAIAVFVLLIACINFMNLTTARSANRAREIGLRKVNGASRRNVIAQFLGESVMLATISLLIAVFIVILVLPAFNLISGKELAVNKIFNYQFIAGFLVITLITGLLAGSYPSLFLSAFRPVRILKGDLSRGSRSGTLRKILVVFQFTLSVGLATGSIIVYKQLDYMRNKDLGYNTNHLLYIPIRGGTAREKYSALKDELSKEPLVHGVSATLNLPTDFGSNSGGVDWEGKDPDMQLLVTLNGVDFDFAEVTEIEMKSGRSFSKDFPGDMPTDSTGQFLINEEMARIMNVEDPVGMRFDFLGLKGSVIGVMKDFHYTSTKYRIEPLAITIAPAGWMNYVIIRIAPENVKNAVSSIETVWNKLIPDFPMEYHFLDEEFDMMYRVEERMSVLLKYFTFLALIIACLGLFGLSSFTAQLKTREIGIRKVNGAKISMVISMLLRESVVLVLVSCILGSIFSFFLMYDWLKDFAYRTSIDWWIFVLASFAALGIAVITVSFQAARAALTNPVEALRYE